MSAVEDVCAAWDELSKGETTTTRAVRRAAAGDRAALAEQIETEVRPLIATPKFRGGYDCCGCSTYDAILDHALRIVRGESAATSDDGPPSST